MRCILTCLTCFFTRSVKTKHVKKFKYFDIFSMWASTSVNFVQTIILWWQGNFKGNNKRYHLPGWKTSYSSMFYSTDKVVVKFSSMSLLYTMNVINCWLIIVKLWQYAKQNLRIFMIDWKMLEGDIDFCHSRQFTPKLMTYSATLNKSNNE